MATVSTVHANDSWDRPPAPSRSNILRRSVLAQSVPDDWDKDDDEEEEVDNQKIWEDANTRAPMPQLLISSSSTTTPVATPPVTAFQGPMRILKRPSQNSSSNSFSSQAPTETLAQREARYQAARERIFGGDDGSGSNVNDSALKRGGAQKGGPSLPTVNVIRNPIGPSESSKDTEGGQVSKGFESRNTKQPAFSTASANINGSV